MRCTALASRHCLSPVPLKPAYRSACPSSRRPARPIAQGALEPSRRALLTAAGSAAAVAAGGASARRAMAGAVKEEDGAVPMDTAAPLSEASNPRKPSAIPRTELAPGLEISRIVKARRRISIFAQHAAKHCQLIRGIAIDLVMLRVLAWCREGHPLPPCAHPQGLLVAAAAAGLLAAVGRAFGRPRHRPHHGPGCHRRLCGLCCCWHHHLGHWWVRPCCPCCSAAAAHAAVAAQLSVLHALSPLHASLSCAARQPAYAAPRASLSPWLHLCSRYLWTI